MTTRIFALATLLFAALGTGCGFGAGDAVFSGFGNSGNHIYSDQVKELAAELAKSPVVPEITDASLTRIFATLVKRAEQGDVDAALVVYRVAAAQRD